MEEFAEETLELLTGMISGVRSLFHLEGVDCHGEPDGVDHPNPDDDGGGALALVWGCVRVELRHEIQEVLVMELG